MRNNRHLRVLPVSQHFKCYIDNTVTVLKTVPDYLPFVLNIFLCSMMPFTKPPSSKQTQAALLSSFPSQRQDQPHHHHVSLLPLPPKKRLTWSTDKHLAKQPGLGQAAAASNRYLFWLLQKYKQLSCNSRPPSCTPK